MPDACSHRHQRHRSINTLPRSVAQSPRQRYVRRIQRECDGRRVVMSSRSEHAVVATASSPSASSSSSTAAVNPRRLRLKTVATMLHRPQSRTRPTRRLLLSSSPMQQQPAADCRHQAMSPSGDGPRNVKARVRCSGTSATLQLAE